MLDLAADGLSWKQGADVVAAPLGEKLALLDTRSNIYYSLEGIGPFLWSCLEPGSDFSTLCAAVVERYGIAPATAEADIAEWLGEMARVDLVTRQS